MEEEQDFKVMIDANLKSITDKVNKYKNTLVLFSFDVVELLDYVDGPDDYYWVYNDRRNIRWSSCVGGFIPLIEYLPKDVYVNLNRVWGYNDTFKVDGGERLEEIKNNGWFDKSIKSEDDGLIYEIFAKEK